MGGTDRRAVRLDMSWWQATLADDPAGRPYHYLFWCMCVKLHNTIPPTLILRFFVVQTRLWDLARSGE